MPYWKPEEERDLIDLVKQGVALEEVARRLDRSVDAISMKLQRLGFEAHPRKKSSVEKSGNKVTGFSTTTTTHTLEPVKPDDLPSAMEALQLLWSAVNRLKELDVSREEVKKLRLVISGVKAYAALHTDYLLRLEKMERDMLLMQESTLLNLKGLMDKEKDPAKKAELQTFIEDLEESIASAKAGPQVPLKLKKV